MTDSVISDDRGPILLGLARMAIANVFGPACFTGPLGPWLLAAGACFVTLRQDRELRGCIGSVEPYRPLLEDVTANARASAFRDPRFPPLRESELAGTRIEVSLLSPREALIAASEEEALTQIRPQVDGLVLQWGNCRGTFLPQVWDALPDTKDFLRELKVKAGLPADFWSDEIRLDRYQVAKWHEPDFERTAQ